MPLSDINVNIGQGGLGRRALVKDGISGLLLYNDTPPTGFATTNIQKIFSVEEAESFGIIEGGTFSADWYHISEFFRAKLNGELWVGYFDVPGGIYDFLDVATMQTTANGEIRLMAVYAPLEAFADTQVTALQGAINTIPETQKPYGLLSSDMSAIVTVTGWAAIEDLRLLTASDVTYIASQDGAGAGKVLFDSLGYSISTLGRTLGDIANGAVNQSIGEVNAFQISNGIELETPAMANGDLVIELTPTVLGNVKDKGYAVIRKRLPEVAGTYHERTPAAITATSDFSFIENTLVVNKAKRLLSAAYTPYLNARLLFKPDGSLTDDTVGFFEALGQSTLDTDLVARAEASGALVTIDPEQDVQATSTLIVSVKIQPTAIAEFITINIGLTVEI